MASYSDIAAPLLTEEKPLDDESLLLKKEPTVSQEEILSGACGLLSASEELDEINETLEALKEAPDFKGKLRLQNITARRAYRLAEDLGTSLDVASQESDNLSEGLEGAMSDLAKKIWEGFLKFLDYLHGAANTLWVWLTDSSGKIKARAEKLKATITGKRSPDSKVSPAAIRYASRVEGKALVFDAKAAQETANWLENVNDLIKRDFDASDKMMNGMAGVMDNLLAMNRARTPNIDLSEAKAATFRMTEAIDKLMVETYLTNFKSRHWKLRSDGKLDNKTASFTAAQPLMPGGIELEARANFQQRYARRTILDTAESAKSIHLMPVQTIKEGGVKVDLGSIDSSPESLTVTIQRQLDAVIIGCAAVGLHKRDWKKRQESTQNVKIKIAELRKFLIDSEKEFQMDKKGLGEARATIKARGETTYVREYVKLCLNVFLRTAYQSSDIYMKQTIKSSKAMLSYAALYTAAA